MKRSKQPNKPVGIPSVVDTISRARRRNLIGDISASNANGALKKAVIDVLTELDAAMLKFPQWPYDPIHAAGAVAEESGELMQAVLECVYEPAKSTPGDARKEAIQTAAMAIRFLMSVGRYDYVNSRQQHTQLDIQL